MILSNTFESNEYFLFFSLISSIKHEPPVNNLFHTRILCWSYTMTLLTSLDTHSTHNNVFWALFSHFCNQQAHTLHYKESKENVLCILLLSPNCHFRMWMCFWGLLSPFYSFIEILCKIEIKKYNKKKVQRVLLFSFFFLALQIDTTCILFFYQIVYKSLHTWLQFVVLVVVVILCWPFSHLP